MNSFVHLHTHSDYSLFDGAAPIADLVATASTLGMPGIGLTDHGNVHGAWRLWDACRRAGLTPVVGMEAYMAVGSRFDTTPLQLGDGGRDDISGKGTYTHLTMWGATTEGVHNLFRFSTEASVSGAPSRWPRGDREILSRYAHGLIGSTGCPSGEVQSRLRFGQYREAVAVAAELRDIFGTGNFYVEVMDHGLEIERRVREDLLRLARELSLPLVATNDIHYVSESGARLHEAKLAVSTGVPLTEPTRAEGGSRFAFESDRFHLASAEEMRRVFAELPEACDNTLAIAERCQDVDLSAAPGAHAPQIAIPEGHTEHSWFAAEVERGLHERFGAVVPAAYRERAQAEADVITAKGFAGYFLVVADYVQWARRHQIAVGPGRGSGPGSLCAYALGITAIDPLEHGLLFERFLNPERSAMPDFDIDFDDQRRHEVVDYVHATYGSSRVAQVMSFGTFRARNSLQDAARALGHPTRVGNQLAKALPPHAHEDGLASVVDSNHPRYRDGAGFRAAASGELRKVALLASHLEGMVKQRGTHPAGVVVSGTPLIDVVPLMLREPNDAMAMTQFDYDACAAMGLVKMDFLALRTLTVITDALTQASPEGVLDTDDIALDDPATLELLARGDTLGVFQLDGGGIRQLIAQIRPSRFADVAATLALYRPGPMGMQSHTRYARRKNGAEEVQALHPELAEVTEEVLGDTYGLIVYQEQVMLLAQQVAGYSLGDADLLRRTMSSKDRAGLEAEHERFTRGMAEKGYSGEAAAVLWEALVPFAGYAFNRAHAVAYGMIAYWTAYLKANHPAAFMAASLTAVDGGTRDLYLAEAHRMGLVIATPDVATSEAHFAADGGGVIRFGLAAISGVGQGLAAEIVAQRRAQGTFGTFDGFVAAMTPDVSKVALAALIDAGAFDSLGYTRRGLMEVHETVFEEARDARRGVPATQAGLLDRDPVVVPEQEWPRAELLSRERRVLGRYVSGHPLDGLEDVLEQCSDATTAQVANGSAQTGRTVTLAGVVTRLIERTSKRGTPWALIVVEDATGPLECVAFSLAWQVVQDYVELDALVMLRGEVSARDGVPQIVVESAAPLPH